MYHNTTQLGRINIDMFSKKISKTDKYLPSLQYSSDPSCEYLLSDEILAVDNYLQNIWRFGKKIPWNTKDGALFCAICWSKTICTNKLGLDWIPSDRTLFSLDWIELNWSLRWYLIFMTDPTDISVEKINCHVETFYNSMYDRWGEIWNFSTCNLIILYMPDVEKSEIYHAHLCMMWRHFLDFSPAVVCVVLSIQYSLYCVEFHTFS